MYPFPGFKLVGGPLFLLRALSFLVEGWFDDADLMKFFLGDMSRIVGNLLCGTSNLEDRNTVTFGGVQGYLRGLSSDLSRKQVSSSCFVGKSRFSLLLFRLSPFVFELMPILSLFQLRAK